MRTLLEAAALYLPKCNEEENDRRFHLGSLVGFRRESVPSRRFQRCTYSVVGGLSPQSGNM